MPYTPVFDVIDLSALPPPEVIESLEYKAIYASSLETFAAIEPNYELYLQSDPIVKFIQAMAYREYLWRTRVNAAAAALLVAKASGADLDHLVAGKGVKRLVEIADVGTPDERVVTETDAQLRDRYLLALSAFSSAGPINAYKFYARSTSPRITDVSVVKTAPGAVTLAVITDAEDMMPTSAQLNAIRLALNDEDIRPLTDTVSVQAAQPIDVDITASLGIYRGPDGSVVLQRSKDALDALFAKTRKVGYDLAKSAVYGALHVEGVYVVNTDFQDLVVSPLQVYRPRDISVTIAGTGE
jgi:phage-related baseplate assembly protein